MSPRFFLRFQFLMALLISGSGPIRAQVALIGPPGDTVRVFDDLFGTDEPLQMTLTFDVKQFQRTRQKEEYQPAAMTLPAGDSGELLFPVRIRARGNYRRDECSTPPFWLNIRYSGLMEGELTDIRRMKVVTRCRSGSQYDYYVLREYLTYRLYNLVTPYSFRTRLVRLTTVDLGRDGKTESQWAILIEPEELMARRLNGRIVDSDNLSVQTVNFGIMDRLAMYQYMIGNGDFSITGQHNKKILAVNNGPVSGFVPIPYDFDYCGLVNTHYAVPNEALPIRTVRERYYQGPCRSETAYQLVIDEFLSLREEMNALILSFPHLDDEEKLDMISYLQTFFNDAAKEDFIQDNLRRTCL
ncbi:MAG: hypothetical protein R2751_09025 [Bacteroidales bacterium]